MKNNLLKVLLALLLACSLLALASCAGLEDVIGQVEQEVENVINNNNSNNNNNNNNSTDTTDTAEEEEADAFAVTFVTDANSSVTVYPTQDMTTGGTANATKAYALDKDTGEPTKVEEAGQVNFVVVLAEGYEIDSVSVTPADGYNKLKGGLAETGVETGYRITKITADLTVTVTTKAAGTAENLEDGYAVTFAVDEHASVTVYKTQELTDETENATVAYSRNSSTGILTKDGKGQVNFLVVVDEGYEIDSVTATPEDNYTNLKDPAELGADTNLYRLTKITGEVTVTITTKVAE